MSMKVGSLASVGIGRFRYVFVLVVWNDYASAVREELDKQFEPFGRQLAQSGIVVKPFDASRQAVASEIQAMQWPEGIRRQIRDNQEPLILVVNTDLAHFDPQAHPWAILWFSQWEDKPETIYRVLRVLAEKVQAGEDIFGYVKSLSKKRSVRKFMKYFELRPNVFGVGLNVNAIVEDAIAG